MVSNMNKKRYEVLPTVHCFQWDIFVQKVMWTVQNIPLETMHCGKCFLSSLDLNRKSPYMGSQ